MKKGELEVTSAVMKVRATSRVYSIWPVIVQTYSFMHMR